jgi:hypothetical protein
VEPDQSSVSYAKAGIMLGAKTGLRLSVLYLLLFNVLVLLSSISRYSSAGEYIGAGAVLFFFTFLIGGLIGVLPATMLGALTGWILAVVLQRRREMLSEPRFWWVSVGICFALALFINFVLIGIIWGSTQEDPSGALSGYLLFLGVPSLAYVAAGGWVGRQLYRGQTTTSPTR